VLILQVAFAPPRNILQARAGKPALAPPKKTPLHSKKRAIPSVGGAASQEMLSKRIFFSCN